MRQEDLDKLTARFNRLVRDMLVPGADYKLVMIVAERFVTADGQKLHMSLGTTASPGIAANLCDMAADEYQAMEKSAENETLIEAVHRIMDAIERLRQERTAVEEPPPSTVTKH